MQSWRAQWTRQWRWPSLEVKCLLNLVPYAKSVYLTACHREHPHFCWAHLSSPASAWSLPLSAFVDCTFPRCLWLLACKFQICKPTSECSFTVDGVSMVCWLSPQQSPWTHFSILSSAWASQVCHKASDHLDPEWLVTVIWFQGEATMSPSVLSIFIFPPSTYNCHNGPRSICWPTDGVI